MLLVELASRTWNPLRRPNDEIKAATARLLLLLADHIGKHLWIALHVRQYLVVLFVLWCELVSDLPHVRI